MYLNPLSIDPKTVFGSALRSEPWPATGFAASGRIRAVEIKKRTFIFERSLEKRLCKGKRGSQEILFLQNKKTKVRIVSWAIFSLAGFVLFLIVKIEMSGLDQCHYEEKSIYHAGKSGGFGDKIGQSSRD